MTVRKGYGFGPEEEDSLPAEQDYTPLWAGAADVSAPPADAPPMVQADPNFVPPELRADYKPPSLPRAPSSDARIAEAFDRDRKRQDQADVRAYLLAAGRREAPQLQKLGTPETDTIEKQLAHQPKAEDPLSREMMLMNVLKARKELAKPEDETGADLRKAELAKILYDLQHPKDPNAEKPGEFLDPAEVPAMDKRYGAQFDGGQLPRDSNGRVRRDLVLRLAAPSENSALGLESREKQGALTRAQQFALDAKKREDTLTDEERTHHIPGLQHSAGVKLGPSDIEDQRTAESEAKEIGKNLDTVIGIVKKKGLDFNPTDPDKAKLEGALTDVQMKLKGKANYGLGVLSGPDQELLNKVTGTPTAISLKNILGGPESAIERLQGVKDRSQSQLASKRTSRGYSPIQQDTGVSTGAPKKTPGGKPYASKGYSKGENKTYWLDASGNPVESADGQK